MTLIMLWGNGGQLEREIPFCEGSQIKFLTLQHTKCASGVENLLLNNNFSVVRYAVIVPTPPVYLMKLPPTVRQVRYGSYFWVKQSTTIRPYVTSFLMFSGILLWGRKYSASAPYTLPPTP